MGRAQVVLVGVANANVARSKYSDMMVAAGAHGR